MCSPPRSAVTPSMVSILDPMPVMLAPILLRNSQSSCTCGSEAALRSMVVPCARTDAITAFSVAVTLASSSSMSAPDKDLTVRLKGFVPAIVHPRASRARI